MWGWLFVAILIAGGSAVYVALTLYVARFLSGSWHPNTSHPADTLDGEADET